MLIVIKRVLQLLLIIGIILGIPIYALGMLGVFAWFKLVVFVGRRYRDLELPVTGVSTFLAPDNLHKRPTCTLVHLAILQGCVNPETISSQLQYLYDSVESDGSRKYKKLGLSIEPWMGYLFWKTVHDFKLKDHIHLIQDDNIDKQNVSTFVEQVIQKPFTKGRPVWDVYILYNNKSEESYVIFRTHHLLLDGMSLLKLWYKANGNEQIPSDLIKLSASSPEGDEIRSSLKTILRMAYIIIVKSPFLSRQILNHPYSRNCITEGYKTFNGKWFCSGINKFHLAKYRQPLRDLKFSLTHVILVAYSRGLGRFIKTHYSEEDVPEKVYLFGSVPRPNYPDEEALTNYWAIMRYTVELLKSDNVREQLEYAKGEYRRAVQDFIPEAFELNHTAFGPVHFPVWFYKLFWETTNTGTLSLSNVPGPKTQQKMFDLPVTDRMIWLPLSRNNSGIGLLFLTYNGWGNISMTVDSGCIKSRDLFEDLNRMVNEELGFVLEQIIQMASDPVQHELNCLVEVTVL